MLRTYAGFSGKYSRCAHEDRINWLFSESLDEDAQYVHAEQFVCDFLAREDGAFKIGITFQPLERCFHYEYGYFTLGYSRVTFVCADENPHVIYVVLKIA